MCILNPVVIIFFFAMSTKTKVYFFCFIPGPVIIANVTFHSVFILCAMVLSSLKTKLTSEI